MSAGYGSSQTARSRAQGCRWHFVKPFAWDELQAIVEEAEHTDEPGRESGWLRR